jgi:hypothetical protein
MATGESEREGWLVLSTVPHPYSTGMDISLKPVVRREDGEIRHESGWELNGLRIEDSVCENNADGSSVYFWSVAYCDIYRITSADLCREMARVLDRVRKGLDKAADDQGPAGSFGVYVLRVCRALKLNGVLDKRENGGSSGYGNASDYRWCVSGADIVNVVDWRVAKAAEKIKERVS